MMQDMAISESGILLLSDYKTVFHFLLGNHKCEEEKNVANDLAKKLIGTLE